MDDGGQVTKGAVGEIRAAAVAGMPQGMCGRPHASRRCRRSYCDNGVHVQALVLQRSVMDNCLIIDAPTNIGLRPQVVLIRCPGKRVHARLLWTREFAVKRAAAISWDRPACITRQSRYPEIYDENM
jgi:hypothetical protein